jgi:transglutaminase-like putative cysteine protease
VTSRRPAPTRGELARAGQDYPEQLEGRFTQLPASTPSRVARRTSVITERASNPYETAVVIEQWLENNREYSLDVDRPEGNIADAFLFEMNRGYCTYYATTMVTMLRSQGIPARMVVGYTSGERVAEDRWVVRGYNSHAWVEVYFPDIGWVRFDPTPAEPRVDAERSSLEQARLNNETDVDTDETAGEGPAWTPTQTETPEPITTTPGDDSSDPTDSSSPTPDGPDSTPGENGTDGESTLTVSDTDSDEDSGGILPDEQPSREEMALGLVVLAGMVAGVRRSGVTERAYRAVWLRWQPRESPAADVERAYRRLEYLLGKRHRPRRAGETPRQYLDAVDADERARRVLSLYERARYAGTVSEDAAAEAVRLVDELTRRG